MSRRLIVDRVRAGLVVNQTVELPQLPNFLRLGNGSTMPVEDLTDKQLRALGKQWTEALVNHASIRRDFAGKQRGAHE